MTQKRHSWLVGGSHTGNIYGSVRVRSGSMAAREAIEVCLIGPVAFFAQATDCTPSAGVTRVDMDHAHTRKLRLGGYISDCR